MARTGTVPATDTHRNHQREEVRRLQAYTVEQVAEILHVGRDKVYFLLRTGQLRSIKIGKLRRITDQHLAALIESLEDSNAVWYSPATREGDMVTENYSLRLDAERRGKLQSIATKQDRDLAYVIRKAIDEYIERHGDE
jgi:excisionase family DNA binding protein